MYIISLLFLSSTPSIVRFLVDIQQPASIKKDTSDYQSGEHHRAHIL